MCVCVSMMTSPCVMVRTQVETRPLSRIQIFSSRQPGDTHTLASEVIVTSRILKTHSLSSSWLLAATSSTGPVRTVVVVTREKT